MEVLDYTLVSKGAAITEHEAYAENPDQFTYVLADENLANLHIYCSEGNENWINCRDNGTATSADSGVIAKLLKKYNTPSA